MVKITFKDVGQGDSIIIEWKTDSGVDKIGIIDCKKKGSQNPILKHICDNKITEIEFVILSHPHTDHYSGFKELLTYCHDKNIIINKFCHTLSDIEVEYWTYFEPILSNSFELRDVFDVVNNSYEKNINQIIHLTFDYKFELFENAYLKCLSPSHKEKVAYLDALKFIPEKNRMKRSKVANLLSTLFKLRINNQYILFTSDVEKITFDRIKDKNLDILVDKKNVLSQIPHHGSINNHEPNFWSNIPLFEKATAVISAGEHKLYNHPHFSVIDDFKKLGYVIDSTNIINGMEKYVEKIKLASLSLDTDSTLDEDFYKSGDKVFDF